MIVTFNSNNIIYVSEKLLVFLSLLFRFMLIHGYNSKEQTLSTIISIPKDSKSSSFVSYLITLHVKNLELPGVFLSRSIFVCTMAQNKEQLFLTFYSLFILMICETTWRNKSYVGNKKNSYLYVLICHFVLVILH